MLMMRLQRVGRKNDPSFRIVVTDKRTGVNSDKHVDRLGSYNPKMNHIQLDGEKAKDWLSKGVQPSDTMYNLLVSQGVIEGKKKNVLPRKSPIIDEEAIKRAEEEAKAKEAAEAEAAKAAESTEEETATPEEAPTDTEESTETEESAPEEAPAAPESEAEELVEEPETSEEPAEATEEGDKEAKEEAKTA